MKTIAHDKLLFILFCFWLLIQLLSFFMFGIVTTNEAVKYRGEAQNLLHYGHFSEQKYIFYSGYIFLHVIFIKAGFETAGVFVIQVLVNLLAMFFFFKTAFNISNNPRYAFLSTLLLIFCYSWQWWTVFMYTESFFCSLVIIFTFLLFGIKRKTFIRYVFTGLLFLLILFTRPTGLLFIPAMCFLLLYKLIVKKKFVIAFFSSILIFSAFAALTNYAMKAGSGYDFMKPLFENSVLCYIPTQSQPEPATHINDNGLNGIIEYFKKNPINFLKLSVLKFLSYWGLTRPYYSALHNSWLRLYFYPLYFFAFIGILNSTQKYFTCYSTGVLIIFTLSVMVSCDDWNNRFTMPVIPLIVLLAGFGIQYAYRNLIVRLNKSTKAGRF